jgi:hypothetical protein
VIVLSVILLSGRSRTIRNEPGPVEPDLTSSASALLITG